jgi:hypothetical protein
MNTPDRRAGQALVEFALVFPLFLLTLFSIIVFGLYVFYNQQLESAVREAARYAAIHSSTAQCPTVSRIDPLLTNQPGSYFRCDRPEDGWPRMTAAARSKVWGMAATRVTLAACWSGLVDSNSPPNADVLPSTPGSTFRQCRMGNVDPIASPSSLPCPAPATIGSAAGVTSGKADGDDSASNIAVAVSNNTHYGTTVTVYACFTWQPPMSGFIFIPSQITLRAIATEALQRQQ